VRDAGTRLFVLFTGHLEGVVPWLYLDILGLLTIAIGNLVDPMQYALSLPFVRPDGAPASREEIAAEWTLLKAMDCDTRNGASRCPWKGTSNVCLAHRGHLAAKAFATLRLTPEGVEQVVLAKLAQIDRALAARFSDFPEWPVDGQFFGHSISWACGPGFRFPALAAALLEQDFAEALKHCHIDESGPDHINGTADDNWGLKPRNVANKIMLANAAKVQGYQLDPEVMLYDVAGAPHVGPTTEPPATHVAPRQSPLSEEETGSGGIIHPPLYGEDWTRPLDD
jgi:hypothetical protein